MCMCVYVYVCVCVCAHVYMSYRIEIARHRLQLPFLQRLLVTPIWQFGRQRCQLLLRLEHNPGKHTTNDREKPTTRTNHDKPSQNIVSSKNAGCYLPVHPIDHEVTYSSISPGFAPTLEGTVGMQARNIRVNVRRHTPRRWLVAVPPPQVGQHPLQPSKNSRQVTGSDS